jgi:hypothetical protein
LTTEQILLMTGVYSVALVAVGYFTRATSRRVVGALAGGAAVGLMVLGMIALCEAQGWWQVPSDKTPYFLPLLYLGLVISCSPIYLITWRVARRFGWRGLTVFCGAVAIIGPPRDYLIARKYPEWMVFAQGVAPILADAAAYVGIVVVGHAVMRLVAGPARGDTLARQPEGRSFGGYHG